ncbi:hypothetical protein [Cellulosimicrobium sp. TH-20]|uniref:hypothetical protein n=1 Tax=unclassified Cellulosimicrobium TaxID=2624466 RepID=UPI0015833383
MTLPPAPFTTPGGTVPAERPARRRPRWLVPLVVVLALVLVAAVALVASLVLGPDRQRRANIAAVSTAFDECDLGGSGATVDRENGSVSFGAVGSSFGPSWGHVECLTDALGMPEGYLTELQEPGESVDTEEYRWDTYMVLRLRSGTETRVSVYHDWWAPAYER